MSEATLVDAALLPGQGVSVDAVSTASDALRAKAAAVRAGGESIAAVWSGLPGVYRSTGAEAVYAAMGPVSTASDDVATALHAVSRALEDWVQVVTPLMATRAQLTADIAALRRDVHAFVPGVGFSGGPVGFLPTIEESWDQNRDLNDRNNQLIGAGFRLGERLRVADEELASAILGAAGRRTFRVTPALRSAPDGVATPWGTAQGHHQSVFGKTIYFGLDFGVGVGGGALQLLQGLGMLGSGYDYTSWPPPQLAVAQLLLAGDTAGAAATGQAWAGQWGNAWVGLGHLVTGVAGFGMAPLVSEVVLPGSISAARDQGWDPYADVLAGVQQWERDSWAATLGLGGSLVGYQRPADWWQATPDSWAEGWNGWGENPGNTAGHSAFNIATVVLPVKGGGAILDALKGGGRLGDDAAAAAAATAGDAARLGSPGISGQALDSVGASGVRLANGTVDDIAARVAATSDHANPLGARTGLLDDARPSPHPSPDTAHPTLREPVVREPLPHEPAVREPIVREPEPRGPAPAEPVPHPDTPPHDPTPATEPPPPQEPAPHEPAPVDRGPAGAVRDPAAIDRPRPDLQPDPANLSGRTEPYHPEIGSTDGGPGQWIESPRTPGQPGMAFQIEHTKVAPSEAGRVMEYRVIGPNGKPVYLDNFLHRGDPPVPVVQELKGDYSFMDKPGFENLRTTTLDKMLEQAGRQVEAFPDAIHEIFFKNESWANDFRNLVIDDPALVNRVDVFHVPE